MDLVWGGGRGRCSGIGLSVPVLSLKFGQYAPLGARFLCVLTENYLNFYHMYLVVICGFYLSTKLENCQ